MTGGGETAGAPTPAPGAGEGAVRAAPHGVSVETNHVNPTAPVSAGAPTPSEPLE